MPSLSGAVLMVEDDFVTNSPTFARDLTSLLQSAEVGDIQGLVIGRFQRASGLTRSILQEIVSRQPALEGLPVLANVDFGHTQPQMTLPIGGQVTLKVGSASSLRMNDH